MVLQYNLGCFFNNLSVPRNLTETVTSTLVTEGGKYLVKKTTIIESFKMTEPISTCHHQILLEEIYRVKLGPLLIGQYGKWNYKNNIKLSMSELDLFRRREHALSGLILEGVAEHSYPNNILEINGGKILKATRIFLDVFSLLANTLNFTFNIHVSPDRKFGGPGPNGNWSGAIGMLHRREVDVGISGFTTSLIRSKVVDFCHPFLSQNYKIFIQKPGASLDWFTYTDVFASDFWRAVAICMITLIASYVGFVSLSNERLHAARYFNCKILLRETIF